MSAHKLQVSAAASAEVFTAAEIAKALGVTPRAVAKHLETVPPGSLKIARGQPAKAWAVESLTTSLFERLAALCEAKKCRSIPDLLNSRIERFQPVSSKGDAISLSAVADSEIESARKLQRALGKVLRCPDLRGAELERIGLESYREAFGHAISAPHWAKLYRRTIDRDRGFEEWQRLEIYLSDSPKLKLPVAASIDLPQLQLVEDALQFVQRPAAPTIAEKNLIWLRVCDQIQVLAEDGHNEQRVKREILKCLLRSGCVGSDKSALQRNLNRKWSAFLAAGGKTAIILDKRRAANKARKKELPERDRLSLLAKTTDCEGRFSQGYREAMEEGILSPETTACFIANPSRKSATPSRLREEVKLDARKAIEARRRPRFAALNGAYVPRTTDGLFCGDSFTSDDCTLPLYWYCPDSGTPLGFRVLRGQFLPMIDERSWLVLSFALHAEPNYNSRVIRSLITATHDKWGLPRRRFRFEKGIWKSSKILKGDELGFDHTELGLREFGVQFSHAQWAHGKLAENVLAAIQNRLERLPGYSSRNEIISPNEPLAKQLREIETGKVHPSKYLLSRDQVAQSLEEIISSYNNEPQEGKWHSGKSPLEVWNENQHPEGLVNLGIEARYLLAHHRLTLKVGRKGLLLRPSLGGGLYANEHTGRFAGQKVLVWVNPDQLDYVALTDMKRQEKPVFVPRVGPVPAIDGGEGYARARQQVADHNNYGRTVFRSIQSHLADHNFRRLAADRATIKMGEDIEAGVERVRAERKVKTSRSRTVAALSAELGIRPKIDPKNLDSIARGAELLREAEELNRKTP